MIEQLEKACCGGRCSALHGTCLIGNPRAPHPRRPHFFKWAMQRGRSRFFREDLKRLATNGWGLFGLEAGTPVAGPNEDAAIVRRQLDSAWKNADTKLDLAWL